MYDEVLNLILPLGVTIFGFADDLMLVIPGDFIKEVEVLATEAFHIIAKWRKSVMLELAHDKTVMVLVSTTR